MNGIVSGKTVDELSAYGRIEEYNLTVAIFQPWWTNTLVNYTSDKFCLPLSIDSATIDVSAYKPYTPFVKVYFSGSDVDYTTGFTVKLVAYTSASQLNYGGNLTVTGKVLILDSDYAAFIGDNFGFGLAEDYHVTF